MKATRFLLPSLSLGGAALLLLPGAESMAFSTIPGSLSINQRDVRVFDNFADAAANNNNSADANFPGWFGVEQAIWKGSAEWQSLPFPNGTSDSDPFQSSIGDGEANFDVFWAGSATAVGNSNQNIVSAIGSCGGGTLAFTETPISDGWRIRFCDNWVWSDGPSSIGFSQFDLQGIMTHEYGHALGLGHSGVNGATMWPSGGAGDESLRSINSDDIAGVQFKYGAASSNKPTIAAIDPDPGTNMITIYGTNFSNTGNEVWFTNGSATGASGDPRVRVTGVASTVSGTQITIPIPANAGAGNVMVLAQGGGNDDLSNAWPSDLINDTGTPPTPPINITTVFPSTIPTFTPGTAQNVVIAGSGFNNLQDVMFNVPPFETIIDPSRYTVNADTSISINMPIPPQVGLTTLAVRNTSGSIASTLVTFEVPTTPLLELGNGDDFNVVDVDDGMPMVIGGPPGSVLGLYTSLSPVPSIAPGVLSMDMGNNFAELIPIASYGTDFRGVNEQFFGTGSLISPPAGGLDFYSQAILFDFGSFPLQVTNLQITTLVP